MLSAIRRGITCAGLSARLKTDSILPATTLQVKPLPQIRMATSEKLFIDTDAGLDDAQAILMALANPHVEVVGIATVAGNVGVEKVNANVLRILKLVDRLDVPVYKGCSCSLLNDLELLDSSHYHGEDGLGDALDDSPPDLSLIKPEPAAQVLIDLVNKYPGEINLVCLGPLTNLAMSIRLEPSIGSKLKHCYIMGGNYTGAGNITPYAEYNFYRDPEAALIVLNELKSPITLAVWELCLKHSISWEWYENSLTNHGNKIGKFFRKVEEKGVKWMKEQKEDYVFADQFAVAFPVDPLVIKDSFKCCASIVLHDKLTRGMMVINKQAPPSEHNVTVVTEVDQDQMLQNVLKIHQL